MIKYLIEKECRQLLRNEFLPKLILIFPCMIMLLMPWAANLEIKGIALTVADSDRSPLSRRLTDKLRASDYFSLTGLEDTYEAALSTVESGRADVILSIPPRFEERWMRGEPVSLLVAVNAVNGTKGNLGSSYLSSILEGYAAELAEGAPPARGGAARVGVDIVPRYLFNPTLDYKRFMVPALMVMLLTLMCGFLPALNVVGEKEAGTIEQINVTPVSKLTFIAAKVLPYWAIGLFVLSVCFGLAHLLYGLFPAGSFLTLYVFAVVFVLVFSGFGLVISNHSDTLQQAMFVMFFFMLVFILMSGLLTPVRSMPDWAQAVAAANPLKYFIEVMRGVYLRGAGFADLLPQLGALLAFAAVFNAWAVLSYRKSR